MKRHGKSYGDTKTSLTLTEKAYGAYSQCDPCTILEYEDEDGTLLYSISGIDDRRDLTEADVNRYFENLADELSEEEDEA